MREYERLTTHKHIKGLGTLPMQNPQMAAAELRRCVQDLGLVGVQIGSHVNDWNLDDPALFPVYEVTSNFHLLLLSN
jgi:aminocarboxymuconate-semialdehyde decarboxylase